MTNNGPAELDLRIDADGWKQFDDLEEIIRKSFNAALESVDLLPTTASATIILSDNSAIEKLNRQWRDKDTATNILSFPAPDGEKTETGLDYLGDMILAYDVVNKEALQQSKALETHLCHLVIHGALHLLGYDHIADDEADKMEDLERTAMTALKLPDPYLPVVPLRNEVEN